MSSYRWVLHDAQGTALRTTEDFDSKEEAEAWMGSEWSSLRKEGAESVALMEESELLYKMSLLEA